MSPQKGEVDGCGTGIVLIISVALLALLIPGVIHAQGDDWDKSSVSLTGQCLLTGEAEFTVSNTGQAMTGETSWREYELGVLTNSGTLQLGAGESQVFSFGPVSGSIEFQVDQRPGHPGSSHPRLTLNCTPTAIKLNGLQAFSGFVLRLPELGNKGGCGRGNMRSGVACTVTDAGAGFVSGTCQNGLWFSRVSTARTFCLDQAVKVNGCEGLGGELYAPIRISR
jgi:hypothetical protein